MSLPAIADLLPHSGSMILLDRVLQADAEVLCAEVCIVESTLFCDGLGVGAWIGIEYMAQAIAAHAGYAAHLRGEPAKVGLLLGARRYEASCPAFPVGSVLHVHVQRLFRGQNGLGSFECRIDAMSDAMSEPPGVTLATATVTVFEPDNVNDFLKGV